jgi:hypothetical protein
MGALLPVSASIRRGSEWRLGQPARRRAKALKESDRWQETEGKGTPAVRQ